MRGREVMVVCQLWLATVNTRLSSGRSGLIRNKRMIMMKALGSKQGLRMTDTLGRYIGANYYILCTY